MKLVDNLIALRIIYLLVTPIETTKAYKLGLIDSSGKQLKKASSAEEKSATSMLHRLVWNLKRVISLAPGGSSRIGSLAAAMFLVKEAYYNKWSENRLVEEYYIKKDLYSKLSFIEEEVLVEKFLSKFEEDAIANVTGSAVSTDVPTKKPLALNRKNKELKHERPDQDFL